MRKIILLLILVIFIIGCTEQVEETLEGTIGTADLPEITSEQTIKEAEASAPVQEKAIEETPKPVPDSYRIEKVPYYGEVGFCYGSSAMMILDYNGFTEEQVQQYKTAVKAGQGGPPDMFTAFKEVGVLEEIRVGYSKDYDQDYADFYNGFLDFEQTILFDNKEQAFEKLKRLISLQIPVIVLISSGNHYVVAVGYDKDFVYINDPDPDIGGVRKLTINNFFNEWSNYKQDVAGNIGFPGEYGMVWQEQRIEEEEDELESDEEGCLRFDGDEEECLSHPECQWMSDEKECESIDGSEDDEDFLQAKIWHTEIADDDGWVGIDSSIAVDSAGNPHISHFDAKNKNLKYAHKKNGVWLKEVIDSKDHLGEESGIGIDSKGNIHISYNDATNGVLKYSKKTGNTWNIEVVDKKSRAHVVTTSLALDSKGNPYIAYNMESPDGDFVKLASWNGNSWKIEEAASGGSDVYLALDSNDYPHIAFVKGNPSNKRVYYTRKTAGAWKTELVDSSTLAGGDCGIDVDSNNYVHITYHDYGKGAIKYAKFDGNSWKIQTVAENRGKQEGLRLAVDSQNVPHIVYVDENKEKLMHAFLDDASWTKEIISKMGIPSIFIDSKDNIYVSHGSITDEETRDPETGEEIEILKYSVKK